MIRVLIAEDEQLVRDALVTLLSLDPDIDVVASTDRGDDVVELVRRHECDVALLDIDMPGMSGLDAAEKLHAAGPACAVVIVTSHGRPGYLSRAVRSGVRGFVTKDTPGARLAEVIREVHQGGRYVDPDIAADAVLIGECPLGARELEILRLAEDGRPLAAIAGEISLSEGTVRNYMSSAISRLGVDNRLGAIRFAQRMGWL